MYLAGQGLRPDVVGWRVERYPEPPQKRKVGARHLGVYTDPPDFPAANVSASAPGVPPRGPSAAFGDADSSRAPASRPSVAIAPPSRRSVDRIVITAP